MNKIKKRKDNRFVKTVTSSDGKRIYFYGKTEKEINRKILEYKGEKEKGQPFKKVAEGWWEQAEDKLEYQSRKSYKPALRRAIDFFGDRSVREIKAKDISNYLNHLAAQGLAQKTIANQKLICSLILDYGVNQGEIEFNPCSSVKLNKNLPKEKRTAASATDEEIVKKTYDIWLFPFIALMTGMRKGEILALTWNDIDFNDDIIKVTKSVYHRGDKPEIKAPKTSNGTRIIPLLSPLKNVLIQLNKNNNDYIISDDGKKPLTNRRYITLYNNYKRRTGIKCTAHQLRHSFATIAFEAGVPVKSVQEILGHAQFSTTMDIYTEFRKNSLHEAKNILEEKLF